MKNIKHVVFIVITLLFVLSSLPVLATTQDPCKGQDTALIIDAPSHTMWMCQKSDAIAEFRIAIGQCGVENEAAETKNPTRRV